MAVSSSKPPAAEPVVIAFDAMAGDRAPEETIRGAVEAVREQPIRLLLVGPEEPVRSELARYDVQGLPLEVVPAAEVISMEEHAVGAVRSRRNSSVVVGMNLVRSGAAEAFVSTGHSGAAMAAAVFVLGRIEGVERPSLATLFPTIHGQCLMLDVGANADCRPSQLMQFAAMGSIYSARVLGVAKPRVGLVSVGEEESKGTQTVQEAHRLLKMSGLCFIGNVEGKDIPFGLADVAVADGFTGNIALKMAEGMARLTFQLIREEASRNPFTKLGGLLMRPAFRGAKRRVDYEEYGGAVLLGVDGIVVVGHGRSGARAIKNAIRVARQSAEVGLVGLIREGVRHAPSSPLVQNMAPFGGIAGG